MADFSQTITIVDNAGTFFRVIRREYEDGSYEERSERLGTALVVQQTYADTLKQQAQSLASSVEGVSKNKKVIGDMKDTDDTIATAAGSRPTDLITTELKADFETSGWTIRETEGGAFVPVVFVVNAQNNLRYTVNGAAAKTADCFGAVLRLRNYPTTGNSTDMYRISNGNYINSDRSV
ncbi:MAG: hypothetical protein IPN33_25625 [Saprospiraceae bacterium]|nr:hypothetical protein [Saprospiraceae bacterium]